MREAYEEGRRRWTPVDLSWPEYERAVQAILAEQDTRAVTRPAFADLYITLAVAGDLPRASDRFVQEYQTLVRRVARACTSNRADADDIESQSLERALLKLGHYKGLCSLDGFLATLVRNIARDVFKSRKAEQRKVQAFQRELGGAAPDDGDTATARPTQASPPLRAILNSALEDDDCLDLFQQVIPRALEILPDDQRLVIQLVLMDDVPSREVATVLGVHESGVTRRKQKALKTLKPAMVRVVRELPGGSEQDLYDCL